MAVEIEAFELKSAMEAWGLLSPEAKERLLWVHSSEPGGLMLQRVEVKTDSKYARLWKSFPDGTDWKGQPKYKQEGYDITYPTTPEWQSLLDLRLIHRGMETSMNWGMSGGPPAYHLSKFGKVVARYGDAAKTVELAKMAALELEHHL